MVRGVRGGRLKYWWLFADANQIVTFKILKFVAGKVYTRYQEGFRV